MNANVNTILLYFFPLTYIYTQPKLSKTKNGQLPIANAKRGYVSAEDCSCAPGKNRSNDTYKDVFVCRSEV